MTRFLIDTNAVIDNVFPEADGELAVSVLTLSELITGVHAASTAELRRDRRERYERLVAAYDPVPVTTKVLEAYWEIDAAEVASGRAPRKRRTDLLLAATAKAHDMTLWTSNVADFRGVEKLVPVTGP